MRASVEQMVGLLPDDDAVLDSWIEEAVRESHQAAFMFLVCAALAKDRPVDARHLAGGTKLLPAMAYVIAIVLGVKGEMPEYLLEGLRNSVMYAGSHGAALFSIALWCD